jgi:putative ABC transport system permease protein
MYRIRDALRALKNRWVISILLLIQFTYGLSTITGSSNIYLNLYDMNFNSLLDLKSTYIVVPAKGSATAEKLSEEQIEKIYHQLEQHSNVISLGTYVEDILLLDTSLNPDRRLVDQLTRSSMTSGLNEPFITGIMIDEQYNELLNRQFAADTGFTSQDFRKNSQGLVPILLGSFFKSYYNLGDLINGKYKIVGFLPDKYLVHNNTSNVYLKLDKAFIMPMPVDRYHSNDAIASRLQQTTILTLKPDSNVEELSNIFSSNQVNLTLKNLGASVQQSIEQNIYLETFQTVLGIAFVMFSITGIVITTIVSLMIRKREFGIKLALGERPLGILGQITIENILIGVIGFGLSLIHFQWKYRELLQISKEINMLSPLDFKLDGSILFIIFIIFSFIIAVSSFIIYLYIRKQDVKSLIGGME